MNTLSDVNEYIMNSFHQCGFSVNTTSKIRDSVRSRPQSKKSIQSLVIALMHRGTEFATCRGILSTESSENVSDIPDQEIRSFSIEWIGVNTSYRKRNIGILLLNLFMVTVLLYKSDVHVFTLDDETDKPDVDNIYVKTGFKPFLHGSERFKLTSEYLREVEDGTVIKKIQGYVEKLMTENIKSTPKTNPTSTKLKSKSTPKLKSKFTLKSKLKPRHVKIRTLRSR